MHARLMFFRNVQCALRIWRFFPTHAPVAQFAVNVYSYRSMRVGVYFFDACAVGLNYFRRMRSRCSFFTTHAQYGFILYDACAVDVYFLRRLHKKCFFLKLTQNGFGFRDLRQRVGSLYGFHHDFLDEFAKNIKCPHLLIKVPRPRGTTVAKYLFRLRLMLAILYKSDPFFKMRYQKNFLASRETARPSLCHLFETKYSLNF
jgi:hypothetical protein